MSSARQGIQSQWLSKFVLLPLFVLNLIVLPTSAQSFQIITTEGRSTTITDPAFTSSQAILADKWDGKPLSAKEGPFRIVVPSDKRPARWVRQVTALRVVVAK